jgi:tetratricopeptide (TPR) repeat protein
MAKARRARPKAAAVRPSRKRAPAAEPLAARVRTHPATSTSAPVRPERKSTYPEAINVYERGIEALQRRSWAEAAERFRELMSRFPEERELHDRAQVYLRVCERELAAATAEPRTNEERLVAATVALNAGQHERTLELLGEILGNDPSNDMAHYMSAAVRAAIGQRDSALDSLKRAIDLNPENRNLARQDTDFEGLQDDEAFQQLLEAPTPAPRRRRPRHGR